MPNFTGKQRVSTRAALIAYEEETDALWDSMCRELEEKLGLDPESIGLLLQEEN